MEKALELSLREILSTLSSHRSDDTAWTRLYECTHTYVFRVSCCVLRADDLAEDATQEVFFRLSRYCEFSRLEDPQAFWGYLGVVCRNVARSYAAQRRRRCELSLTSLGEGPDIVMDQVRIDLKLALDQVREIAFESIKHSRSDSTLLQLWLNGTTLREIASELGVTYSSAAVRIHRIQRKLCLDNKIRENNEFLCKKVARA